LTYATRLTYKQITWNYLSCLYKSHKPEVPLRPQAETAADQAKIPETGTNHKLLTLTLRAKGRMSDVLANEL